MEIEGAVEDKAIALGHPSYVWRAGQDRRLGMIRQNATLSGARILDIGCGLGLYVQRFRAFSDDVHGIDVDPEKVRQASAILPNIREGSAEALPYQDSTFDVALLHEVLEHVTDDRRAVQEAYRVLRPGGRLVIFVPNRYHLFETHGVYWRGVYHAGNIPLVNYLPRALRSRLCPHVRAYGHRDLLALLEGLRGRVVIHRCVFAGYDNVVAKHPLLGRLLRRVSYVMEATPLHILGLSHFLVYEKSAPSTTAEK